MVRQDRIDEYFASTDISQSQLKLLLGPNPSLFNTIQPESELYYEEKEHFIIGDGVDIQLTGSLEDFNRKYHVSNVQNKPSDKIKSIVNEVFDTVVREYPSSIISTISHYRDTILEACSNHDYYTTWKDDSRVAKVVEAWEYWEDLKASQGKIVLSREQNDKISSIVMSFRTHRHTAEYFKESGTKEILYQIPIYFEYGGVRCRALLDMMVINHKDKTIQPIDIKTLSDSTLYFPKSLRRRRYDIQAAFYTQAVESLPELEGVWKDYKILPFKFLVESTTYPGTPLVFTCNRNLLYIGKHGRPQVIQRSYNKEGDIFTHSRVEAIKGFHDLLEDYNYYMNYGFEVERRVREAQGEFNLDWDGII